ncbi:MAG TPA: hypothetical protein PLK47_08070 [Plasticicumulans sp.]|nr:hypothetical protein [Plasticicumulans sp.]
MHWKIPVAVVAPFAHPALSDAALSLPGGISAGPCHFTLTAAAPAAGDTQLSSALAAAGFAVSFDTPAVPLPAPWQTLIARPEAATLARARTAETALALGLIAAPKRRPADTQDAGQQVQRLDDLPARVAEGLAFGLLDGRLPLDPQHPLLSQWQAAIHACVHGRSDETLPRRDGGSALLAGLRALLEALETRRSTAAGLADWQAGWHTLMPDCPAPAACGLVYWSEATYRLSEHGDFEAAAAALAEQQQHAEALGRRLPGLGDALETGLWRHHLGRLAYYAGRFSAALGHYAAEWRHLGSLDPLRRARLYRHVANLLSDLGELAAAEQLTVEAITTLRRHDDPETFKALGRLGEIRLRRGDGAGAQAAFAESQQLQGGDSAQTAVYRGHAALVAGDPAAAAAAYAEAETLAEADNPYLWMGQAVLYRTSGEHAALAELQALVADDLDRLSGTRALPAAVFASACLQAGLDGAEARLAAATDRLLAAEYRIEALYPLVQLHARPSGIAATLAGIEAGLAEWAEATAGFLATTRLPAQPHGHPTPAQLRDALAACRATDDWQPLAALRRCIHPFSLLETARR